MVEGKSTISAVSQHRTFPFDESDWPVRFRLILAALALTGFVPVASAAHAASQSAKVSASVLKPITVTWVQNLDLGTVVLTTGTWSNATIGISRAGAFSCTSPRVTCSGAPQVAKYNVTGSNSAPVRISAPNVTLVKQGDPSRTLTLVVDNPGTVTLPNSGNRGVDFSLGGAITVNSTTAAGSYVGTFNVTVDY